MVDDNVEVDDDGEDGAPLLRGKVLHVFDIQSGDILQSVRFDFLGSASAILVDGDEIFITSFIGASTVCVLRFAGSEA